MYGILLVNFMDSIKKVFGEEIWESIQTHLDLEGSNIITHNTYPDQVFVEVVEALMMFRQQGDWDWYMEFFGNQFVSFFSNYGFDKMLRVAGRSYRDFLHSIDQLHDSNRFTFPKMMSPLFYVSEEDAKGCYLHYQSRRRGFNFYVVGQLKECGRKFFDIDVNAYVHEDLSDEEFDFENSAFLEQVTSLNHIQPESPIYSVTPSVMLQLFPFSVGFDKTFTIKFFGSAFENLFVENLMDHNLYDVFKQLRPLTQTDWDRMLIQKSIIFELENRLALKYATSPGIKITLKGQMKHFEEFGMIFFLGHPVLTRMEQLEEIGLYLNDLNKYDGTAEMLVTELQHSDQLRKAFDAQHAVVTELQTTRKELNSWKAKSKKLLYSLIPPKIAKKIERGVAPNTIFEAYDEVTIMFANTADFKSIMKDFTIEPMHIIDFINTAILLYDRVVSTYNNVNKIETKADGSYMVVAGIDNDRPPSALSRISGISTIRSNSLMSLRSAIDEDLTSNNSEKRDFPEYNQVELVCAVALEILETSSHFANPFDRSDHLKIQIGIHTGQVVAGIVGLSNIQFCMFGDAVNTSSRMCSNSQPGRILVSEVAHTFLAKSDHFVTEYRDKIKVKGKGMMDVYWVIGKKQN